MLQRTINKSTKLIAVVMLLSAILAPTFVVAQTSSINAYSPYTMYGIGEQNTLGNTVMRSMGGVGVAWRSTQMVSSLNPAGYSATMRKGFLFDISAEGNFLKNRQNKYDIAAKKAGRSVGAKNTINVHEVAVQFPICNRVGFGLSVMPYSSVGYKLYMIDDSPEVAENIGSAAYAYTGDGDVTEVKAGIGWEPFTNFSIGFAMKYYWGDIQHQYQASFNSTDAGSDNFVSVMGGNEYAISSFKFQAGVQWNAIANNKRILTFGATYDYGGALKPKINHNVYIGDLNYTNVINEKSSSQMRLPHTATVGVMYQDSRFTAGVDYQYQSWSANDGYFDQTISGGAKVKYIDTNTIKVGFEYTPNRFDVRHYLKRIAYRVGFRYGNYYQQFGDSKINQGAITAGLGFPIKFLGNSSIDLALEYGWRGSLGVMGGTNLAKKVGLIRQDYFKVSVGFSLFGEDYWFVRPKFD